MNDDNLYEYAVLRYVPDIERGEFINVGLAMMSKRRRWIRLRYGLDPARLAAIGGELTLEQISRQLDGFRAVAEGASEAGPIAGYPVEERFRWLTAAKSCVLQTSPVHPGLSSDLDATFDRLYARLVD
ncbi:MAG: DUF3037 domain-containing protein [Clostridium sp.]|nr:DUF3037 domain-containing protein [Clostridium sp.]